MSVDFYFIKNTAPGKNIPAAGQNNPVAKIRFPEGIICEQRQRLFKMPAIENAVKHTFIFG